MSLTHLAVRRRGAELFRYRGVLLTVLRRYWRPMIVLASGGLLAAMLSLVSGATAGSRHAHAAPPGRAPLTGPNAQPRTAADGGRPPNIVYVLTDDLSRDLLPYMPAVQQMQRQGVTFSNFFVSDSLCCPSRSTIFTGDFPHDTGVFTNAGKEGGITAFYKHEDQNRSFNIYLQQAGYQTAFMGKYLNGYLQGPTRSPIADTAVPPGWNEWDGAGFGYPEFDYELNQNGRLHYYGHQPRDYLTDVIARRGAGFVRRTARAGKPFFLELATFAPHQPYTPPPRYKHAFAQLNAPEPAAFDTLPTDAPKWLSGHGPLTAANIRYINRIFRKRAESDLAVDDLINRIKAALRATGQLRNTYIVFNSDNGLHTGEYRLMPGKLTAFDTDIHVPLVIDGPGVPAGVTTSGMAENTDLAKTFEQIAGTSAPCDGHSLMPLLSQAPPPADWRNAVLVEHHGPDLQSHYDDEDPDGQDFKVGNPTTYEAMRTPDFLYVEYRDGEREFYDLRSDPQELHNLASSLSAAALGQLHTKLQALERCHTGDACWAAEHVGPAPTAAGPAADRKRRG